MPVVMALAALEQDADLRPDVREDIGMMKRNIEVETKLLNELLDLSRITTGKVELEVETVDLNEIVRHACESCRFQMCQRDIRLETEFREHGALIAADSPRLQQVLRNVLENAVKFSLEKSMIKVTTARQAGGRWEVRVRDSGIGIPAERISGIFDAFEQGGMNVTRKYGGLGIGLTACKALVELHQGSIRAESAGPGQGSTFIVELPGQAAELPVKRPDSL
jgi:signal transduction histidine kinase